MGFLRSAQTGGMDDTFDFEAEVEAKDVVRQESLRAEGISSSEGAANRGTRTVCRHWLKNLCMKGDKCDYLHVYDPNRMPECLFFLKYGKCTDPDCNFRHVAVSERPECQRYRLGFCKFGPLCRSRHDRLPKDKMPDLLPDWFLNAILENSRLVPRAAEVELSTMEVRGRSFELALDASYSTEQGAIPGLPPPIHGKCRFFVMRSSNLRNVQISACKGIWASGGGNTSKLCQGLRDVDHVIMIFTSAESRSFLGYARMISEPDHMLFPGIWGEFSARLSPSFKVQWLKQCGVNLGAAGHIRNPQNDDLPVHRCRDGQELPGSVGERLCRFLWQQNDEDIVKGSDLEFEPRVRYEFPTEEPKDQLAEAPLALEDAKKDSVEPSPFAAGEIDDPARPRPAPVVLGTFQRHAKDGKAALASKSSSLLAALTEEAPPTRIDGVSLAPPSFPSNRWRSPPEWLHHMGYPPPPGPGYFHPPPFHHPPPHHSPYGYGPPPGLCGPPRGYYEGPPAAHFAQPPSDWQGAACGGRHPFAEDGNDGGRRRNGERSRSRPRKRRRK